MRKQILFLVFLFIIFGIVGYFLDFYSKKFDKEKQMEVCDKPYFIQINNCKLVKSWIVLTLENNHTLVFSVKAPNDSNISLEFSQNVFMGDIFHKNEKSNKIIIEKKGGEKKIWRIDCVPIF